ncbi:MAG: Rossmann-like domain-containing protein [Syntrophomonadaceae bacterium]
MKEAIGKPERQDFPLLTGKEVLVQAEIDGCVGQAFTANPREYKGPVAEVLRLSSDHPGNLALQAATLNALAKRVGLVDHTVHCRDTGPELCAQAIARTVLERHGKCRVGIIGYQPAILENCASVFGPENVRITDLNPSNIGQTRYGVKVWNGENDTAKLAGFCDIFLVTGTVLTNGTFNGISHLFEGKPVYFYGTTAAAFAVMNELPRLCEQSS